MWINIVEPDTPQMTIWRMFIVCWVTNHKLTLRISNTHCFSTKTMVTRTRLIVPDSTLPVFSLLSSNAGDQYN